MQGGRAATTTQGFTAKSGDLCGYEGGRRGPSHPETADPGSASGDIELSTPQGGTTNKVAKESIATAVVE